MWTGPFRQLQILSQRERASKLQLRCAGRTAEKGGSRLKILGNVITILAAAMLIWIAVSWADVIIHSDPVSGNGDLMPGNAVELLTNIYR